MKKGKEIRSSKDKVFNWKCLAIIVWLKNVPAEVGDKDRKKVLEVLDAFDTPVNTDLYTF